MAVEVIVIGDDKYYRDVERTTAMMPHIFMSAIDDITASIGVLAQSFAPGNLKLAVGREKAERTESQYRGAVGVKNDPHYTRYVYGGTGLYGPKRQAYTIIKRPGNPGPNWARDRTGRLNPAVGNVMKFQHNGQIMFRSKVTVRGQRPQPFLHEAYGIVKHTEIPLRVRLLVDDIVHHERVG